MIIKVTTDTNNVFDVSRTSLNSLQILPYLPLISPAAGTLIIPILQRRVEHREGK